MASPPSNYNPEASLLQGGTSAPILPVQGGGFMTTPPNGFNPSVSLLDGGTSAPIQAIRGGAIRFAPESEVLTGEDGIEKVETKKTNTSDKVGKANYIESDVPVVEQYNFSTVTLTPIKTMNNTQKKNLFSKYTTRYESIKKMKGQNVYGPMNTVKEKDTDGPLYSKCKSPTFFQNLRKRVKVIKTVDPYIWLVPNIEGSKELFLRVLSKIPKEKRDAEVIDTEHIVIFPENFFSSQDQDKNKALFDEFLRIKMKNENNIFLLVQRNEAFLAAACAILEKAYPTNEKKDMLLLPFLEPDILFFPKTEVSEESLNESKNRKGYIISQGDIPASVFPGEIENIPVENVKSKPSENNTLYSEKSLPDEYSTDDSTAIPSNDDYFILNYSKPIIHLPPEKDIECPEGEVCEGFLGGWVLPNLQLDGKFSGNFTYLVYTNRDGDPFLHEAVGTPTPSAVAKPSIPTSSTTPEQYPKPQSILSRSNLQKKARKAKLEGIPFKPDPQAKVDVDTVTFELYFKPYTIRSSFGEPEVRENWEKLKFTASEIEFLQDLHITPNLFGQPGKLTGEDYNWEQGVADFLEGISLSSCFQDTSLLSQPECNKAKEFVRQLFFSMMKKNVSHLASMGKQLIEVLQLGDIEVVDITKNEFVGDAFGEKFLVYYNVDTGEYFADMPVLTEEVQKQLTGIPLKKFRSKDLSVVIQKIEEIMGGKKAPLSPELEKKVESITTEITTEPTESVTAEVTKPVTTEPTESVTADVTTKPVTTEDTTSTTEGTGTEVIKPTTTEPLTINTTNKFNVNDRDNTISNAPAPTRQTSLLSGIQPSTNENVKERIGQYSPPTGMATPTQNPSGVSSVLLQSPAAKKGGAGKRKTRRKNRKSSK